MKLFVVAAILGVCSAARLDNVYLPPRGGDGAGYGAGSSPGGFGSSFGRGAAAGSFGSNGAGFRGSAVGAGFGESGVGGGASFGQGGGQNYQGFSGRSNSADANAQILKLNSEVTAEGFSYDFETSNGIRADASGVATNGVQSQGSFSYKGDDGQDYTITYTADENGYQPRGAHLPTPPPIPEEILKSLEQNARDEAAGIIDDGSYRGEGAGGASGYSSQGAGSGYSGQGAGSGYSGQGAGSGYSGQAAGSGFSGQGAYSGNRYNGQASGSFGGSSSFGGSAAGGAASRQYLTPNVGARGSGNGNFNSKAGYQY